MKPAQRRSAKVPGDAFWRLLGDYEDISGNETAALREQDFGTLAAIHALKAEIFAAMEASSRQLGIDRQEASLRDRLEKIAAGERSNHDFITRLLAANAAERKALNAARTRMRALQHSYVSQEPTRVGSLLALG